VGAREEAELRLRAVLAAQRALAAALDAQHAGLTRRLAAVDAAMARLATGDAAASSPREESPLAGGGVAAQDAFRRAVRARAAAATADAHAAADAALAARLAPASAADVAKRLREAHALSGGVVEPRLQAHARDALAMRLRLEAARRDAGALSRSAVLAEQARAASHDACSRARCSDPSRLALMRSRSCLVLRRRAYTRASWRRSALRRRSGRQRRRGVGDATGGCAAREASPSLRCHPAFHAALLSRAQASFMVRRGSGGAAQQGGAGPANAHAADAAAAVRDLRALYS
jgi:hypothetical protein